MAAPIGININLSPKLLAAQQREYLRLLLLAAIIAIVAGRPGYSQQFSAGDQQHAGLPDAPMAVAAPQAQENVAERGNIHGIVVDRDGTPYEGVRVTLTQPNSVFAVPKTTTSGSNGRFEFVDIAPGKFVITADASGFATQKIPGLLHPGESLEIPKIALLVASTTSEVEVTASRYEIAQEEVKQEEEQRVFGAIPNFYVVYAPNAPPLSRKQKYHLAWRTEIDPFTFLVTGAAAGIQQADDDFRGYGQGAEGYAKRYGANYADGFISTMLGGAVLPSIFKQDPRYFYKGTGSKKSRALYAIAMSVICKGDNGHWQFNYSGILGGLAAAGISNIYYPAADRNGAQLTFQNTAIGIGGSAIGNLFQEFLVRKLTPKVPDYSTGKP